MEHSTASLLEDATVPPPWKALEDNSSGCVYYWNSETNCMQWSKPGSRGGKGKRRQRRRRKAPVTPNGPDKQQDHSKAAAAAPVPLEAQVVAASSECKSSSSAAPPSDGAASVSKMLQTTGEDGDLGILGEYHLKSDLYDCFSRYEKAGVDPKNRKECRFLTHFKVGPGRWVVSDWEELLLLGPVAEKRTIGPNAPEHYTGKYEVCKDVKCRCQGVVKIEVAPVKDESKLSSVMHSFPSTKKAQDLDEDAQAVRKRFHEQMNDAVHDGTFDDSDADIPFAFPWAGQDQKRCEHCVKKGEFKCSRCNFTYYYSESHQAAHQKVCEQLDGMKLTRHMEEMLRWVGPVDSDDECAGDPFKTSAFDLRCLLAAGKKFSPPGSFEYGDDDDDDDPFGFGIHPFDEDMIRSTLGMSGFDFRSLNGSLYTMDQRYQGSYEDAMNAMKDFCPDADDPRFW